MVAFVFFGEKLWIHTFLFNVRTMFKACSLFFEAEYGNTKNNDDRSV